MSSSKRVIFIRHALPVVQEAVSSRLWPLSDDGRRAVLELAGWLRLPAETYVVSSDEAKARETAEAFSDGVALDHRLREVSRPWIDGDYKSLARSW
ncbi:MAG: histidine phosphatase family protein, partial [Rhodothermia bacterium]